MWPSLFLFFLFGSASVLLAQTLEEVLKTASASPRPGFDLSLDPTTPPSQDPIPESGITGEWRGCRTRLDELGITPFAVFSAELFYNLNGGLRSGSNDLSLLDFGLEIDLGRLWGWTGSGFTISALYAIGQDGSERLHGDFGGASNLYAGTSVNLFNVYFSQTWAEESLSLKVGQIAVDDDFMGSDPAGLFLNSSFGALPTLSANGAAPIFPLASPGAFLRCEPTESFGIQLALFSGQPGEATPGNHGLEWRTGGHAGWLTFLEADYSYGPGTLKIGGYHHTAAHFDPDSERLRRSLSAAYFILDHHFTDPTSTAPGFSAFLRLSLAIPEERAIVTRYLDAGFTLESILTDEDLLGIAVSHSIFGTHHRQVYPNRSSHETVMELTYQLPLHPFWLLQPNLQYIFNAQEAQRDTLISGFRTTLAF